MNETSQTPMPLLTPDHREQLLANGPQNGRDHVSVVKSFNPVASAHGSRPSLMETMTCFGLAELGFSEIGSFSLEELATLELPFGMHIERDRFFTGTYPDLGLCRSRP